MADLMADSLVTQLCRLDLLLLAVVVLYLIYWQYLRIARTESVLYGLALDNPRFQLAQALVAGLAGGLLATFLFVCVGIPISGIGIWYIWMVALVLALFSPRFFCFSYAGSLVSLAHLVWGVPRNLHVPAVLALIGALHLVEAFLVAVNGAEGATPVYVRSHQGHAVGAFLLQRAWPIPFLALVAGGLGPALMPVLPWWPLIRSEAYVSVLDERLIYSLLPVFAALGYSELAITCRPREKARHTASLLVVYGLLLLALSACAQHHEGWTLVAIVFAPLGHEAVVYWGRQRGIRGEPLYVAHRGVMVLGVLPQSPAAKMGLVEGDVIVRFNDECVRSKSELAAAMYPWAIAAQVEVRNLFTGRTQTLVCEGKVPPLGAILAPGPDEPCIVDLREPGAISRWWRERRQRWAGGRSF
jgi:hypothetical protein